MFKDLTARQWQLYSTSMNCDTAAIRLNNGVRKCLKKAKRRYEFISLMDVVLAKYDKYGAYDTEPRNVVEDIADREFGEGW